MGSIMLSSIVAAVLGYLFGSINSAILVGRLLKHKDIRDFGSGNAGLTNTLRCFGKGCAALTLIGDLGKGVVAVLLSRLLAHLFLGAEADVIFVGYIAGVFAIIGHVFPLYYGFKGGKGVLVGVSIFLVLDWRSFLILIAIFALVLWLTKYVCLGSMIASGCCPIVTFVSQMFRYEDYPVARLWVHAILAAVMAGMIIYMHRANIERLRNGTEYRIGEKPKMEVE